MRGVLSIGATQAEAESAVQREAPAFEVVRSRKIDLSDHRLVREGRMPNNWWAVVIQHPEPENDPLPQQEDPEREAEAGLRRDLARNFGQ